MIWLVTVSMVKSSGCIWLACLLEASCYEFVGSASQSICCSCSCRNYCIYIHHCGLFLSIWSWWSLSSILWWQTLKFKWLLCRIYVFIKFVIRCFCNLSVAGKLLGSFLGKCSGSIRSIVRHRERPVIASCGKYFDSCYMVFVFFIVPKAYLWIYFSLSDRNDRSNKTFFHINSIGIIFNYFLEIPN